MKHNKQDTLSARGFWPDLVTFFVIPVIILSLGATLASPMALAANPSFPTLDDGKLDRLETQVGKAAKNRVRDFLSDKDDEFFGNVAKYIFGIFFDARFKFYSESKGERKATELATDDATSMAQDLVDRILLAFPEIYAQIDQNMGRPLNHELALDEALLFVRRLVQFADYQTLIVPKRASEDPNFASWKKIGPYDLGAAQTVYIFTDNHGDFPSLIRSWIDAGIIDPDLNILAAKGSILDMLGDNIDGKPYSEETLKFMAYMQPRLKAKGVQLVQHAGNHEVIASSGNVRPVTAEELALIARTTVGKNGDLKDLTTMVSSEFTEPDTMLGKYIRALRIVVKIGDQALVHAGWDVWGDSFCNGNTPDRINYTAHQWFLYFQGLRKAPPPMNTAWVIGIRKLKIRGNGDREITFSHDDGPTMVRYFGNKFRQEKDGTFTLIKVDEPNKANDEKFPGPTRATFEFLLRHSLNVKSVYVGHHPNHNGKPMPFESSYLQYPPENGKTRPPLLAVLDSAEAFGGQSNGLVLEGVEGKNSVKKVLSSGKDRYFFPDGKNGKSALRNAREAIGTFAIEGESFTVNKHEAPVRASLKRPVPESCGSRVLH